MIKNKELKIYDMDNNWNKIGKKIRKDFSNMTIDKISNVKINFENGTSTTLKTVVEFEYYSDLSIDITSSLINVTLYNAYYKKLKIKNIEVSGIIVDVFDDCRKYYFETEYRDLKIKSCNLNYDNDNCGLQICTLVDVNEEL